MNTYEPIFHPALLSKVSSFWWSAVSRRPLHILMLGGLLMAVAYPPLPIPFLSFLGFIPILSHLYLKSQEIEQSYFKKIKIALRIYPGLFLWNLGTCYWLMLTALSVPTLGEAVEAFTAGFLAVTLNPLLMLIPTMLFYFILRNISLIPALLSWITLWLTFEYLHFNWDLTWSWVTLGHAFTFYPKYIQYIEYTGVLGISFHALMANSLFFLLLHESKYKKSKKITIFASILIAWMCIPLVFLLIPSPSRFDKINRSLYIRVIQPNINPYAKFNPDERREQILTFIRLISQPPASDSRQDKNYPQNSPNVHVLPETAFPGSIYRADFANDEQLLPVYLQAEAANQDLLTGAVVYEYIQDPDIPLKAGEVTPIQLQTKIIPVSADRIYDSEGQPAGLYVESYNAALVAGDTTGTFFKKGKLVPFVERVPFMEKLSFLKGMNIDLGGSFGSFGLPDSLHGLKLKHSNITVAPIVCYESQFGDHVRQIVKNSKAGFIAILTNDGWFGASSGHIQHAHMATLRAIENRRWIARSANTGKSLFISPDGEVVQSLGWNRQGFIDQKISLYDHETFYIKYGDWPGKIAIVISFFMLTWAIFIQFKR